MKKAIFTLAILAMVASTSLGAATFSFEQDNNSFSGVDGYSATVGVTDGSYSATHSHPGGWTFGMINSDAPSHVAPMGNNTQMLIDFTRTEAVDNYSQIFVQIVQDGSADYNSPYLSLLGGGLTETLAFDYGTMNPTAGWSYIKIGFNGDAGTFNVDNIRFVPEPASLAMLGLGGLAILRRRRI
jgi:PEP-CTERM motif